ncbi:hypothetical protein D3C81_1762490 [compost metagenome]
MRLMPQAMVWALLVEAASGGPNIISTGNHQRLTASCTISRWAPVPRIIASSASNPWRW